MCESKLESLSLSFPCFCFHSIVDEISLLYVCVDLNGDCLDTFDRFLIFTVATLILKLCTTILSIRFNGGLKETFREIR